MRSPRYGDSLVAQAICRLTWLCAAPLGPGERSPTSASRSSFSWRPTVQSCGADSCPDTRRWPTKRDVRRWPTGASRPDSGVARHGGWRAAGSPDVDAAGKLIAGNGALGIRALVQLALAAPLPAGPPDP